MVTRIDALEEKFDAALIAYKEATAAAFVASEKAILKAEDSQRELNIKNNEFRGQLKDQSGLFIASSEARIQFTNLDDKIAAMKNETDIKLDLLRKEIQTLRESRSEGSGKQAGAQLSWTILVAAIGILGTIVSILVGASVLLRR